MSDNIGIAIFAVILIALRPIYRAWQRYVNDLNVKNSSDSMIKIETGKMTNNFAIALC